MALPPRTAPGTRETANHGASLVMLAALQWALLGPVARIAFAEGVPPLTVAFWRATVAALLFATHAQVTRTHALRTTDRLSAMALGVVAVAGLYVSYFESVQRGGAALAAILLYSAPVWVALGAHVVLRERVALREAGSTRPDARGRDAGGALSRAGQRGHQGDSGCSALGPWIWRRIRTVLSAWAKSVRPQCAGSRHVMGVGDGRGGAAPLRDVECHELARHGRHRLSRDGGHVRGLSMQCERYSAYGPSRAATIATLEPVLAVGAAYLVWGERLSLPGMAGAAAVIGGVLIAARAR